MAVCQNLVPLVNIKIAGKWMFIPLKMVLIGIDPYPYDLTKTCVNLQQKGFAHATHEIFKNHYIGLRNITYKKGVPLPQVVPGCFYQSRVVPVNVLEKMEEIPGW